MERRTTPTKVSHFSMAAAAIGAMLWLQTAVSSVRANASDFSRTAVAEMGAGQPQPWSPAGTGSPVDPGTQSLTRPEPGLTSDPWMDGAWSLLQPQQRSGHCAIYDPDGDRILVFGGADGSSYRNDVWEYSFKGCNWRELPTTGSRPTARYYHSAIYDPVRKTMVVFGGKDGNSWLNDTWVFSLQTGSWNQLTTWDAPGVRFGHTAIYDSLRDRMVVFGGRDPSYYYYDDTWVLSLQTNTWTQLKPCVGPARAWHSAIYDPVGDRMVVFGGYYNEAQLNDTWALAFPGCGWSLQPPTNPPDSLPTPRHAHAAVYVPVDQMVVVGGTAGPPFLNDTWVYRLSTRTWRKLEASTPVFSARDLHSLVYDSLRGRMVLFGGYDGRARADMWSGTLGTSVAWDLINCAGTLPGPRRGPTAVYDPNHDLMAVFGGFDGSYIDDVWALRPSGLARWDRIATSGTPPAGRCYHSAIYDGNFRRMVIFGGDGGSCLNDTWKLSLQDASWARWTQLTTSGTPPSPRYGHSAIFHPSRGMVVFGGFCGSFLNDTYVLSLLGDPPYAWQPLVTQTPEGLPPGRYFHTAIYDPLSDRMVVFGGCTGSWLGDVWALEFSSNPPTWHQLTPAWGPTPRCEHTAVYNSIDSTMVVFGGYTGGIVNDVWKLSLNPARPRVWAQLQPAGPWPSPRYLHAAVFRPQQGSIRGRMLFFGGYAADGNQDATGALIWLGPDNTTSTPAASLPARFFLHQNWPNPFNPMTTISFDLPAASSVRLQLLDVAGRVVRELVHEDMGPGTHKVQWDGRDDQGVKVASGVYLYRIKAGSFSETRKLVLVQ